MLFHSSLRKELARAFGATLIVLVTVVMTMTLIRTLGQASRGSFNPSDVMMVMGYTVLAYMPTILTMSLFIAIVSALSRMYRDSEMVIWFCSGRGLASFLAPLLRFAWPILAAIAMLALFVLPWSNSQVEELRSQYERRGDLDRVEPGQFQESASGDKVFFVERETQGGQSGNNVFIATTEKDRETVTSARSGRIEVIGQAQFLVLNSGQQLEKSLDTKNIKISEFSEYGARVGGNVLTSPELTSANTRSTLALLSNPSPLHLAELSWRLGLALAAINLVVLAVAVSSVNPRVGRSGNMIFAMFAFVVYFNLLNLGQSWITLGQTRIASFMLLLHGGACAIALLWLALRHNHWSWRSLGRSRPSTANKVTA